MKPRTWKTPSAIVMSRQTAHFEQWNHNLVRPTLPACHAPGPHYRYPGLLFVVEGTDGSGKSTQLLLLYRWLKSEGYSVFFSEWNSSPLVKDTTRRAKKRHLFTPATFSLLQATDFADRAERNIIPPLKAGAIVLADRYIYTAFARDVARGCERSWVREVYKFAVKPTAAFFFRTPLNVAINRIASSRPKLKFYEAGMDMNWADDEEESFKIFQGKILREYDQMVDEFGLTVVDATQPIPLQQRQMREIVSRHLKERFKEVAPSNEGHEILRHGFAGH